MQKKIRFPLVMDNEIEVRSMVELQSNFSLDRILYYIYNGRLVIWLKDRYENDVVEKIETLDKNDLDLPKKVCEIFSVTYDEISNEEQHRVCKRMEAIKRLREFMDEDIIATVIERVALNQDELNYLLRKGESEIYLFENKFNIPLSVRGVSFRGINNPVVSIDSTNIIDWASYGVIFDKIKFDEKYQNMEKEDLCDGLDANRDNNEYVKDSSDEESINDYLISMISDSERGLVEEMCTLAKRAFESLNYYGDTDITEFKRMVYDSELVEMKKINEQKNVNDINDMKKMVCDNNLVGMGKVVYISKQ